MRLAIKEAKKGLGRTSPNPCVGAVVVKEGLLIAKGYHKRAGTPHAEINALKAAGDKARGATLYVTLEPCNHTGRTPPCTEAILAAGIQRVVIGMPDPNPYVVGGGSRFLVSRGMTVDEGVLEEECRSINRPFIKHVQTGLPWVTMKAGVTLDGRIAPAPGQSVWITNERSKQYVHRLRDRFDAILVGIDTVLADDPALTTRLASARGKDPVRIILDTHLRLPLTAKVLDPAAKAMCWIFCGLSPDQVRMEALQRAGARVTPTPPGQVGGLDLRSVLEEVGRAQLNSLLVEGGGRVHGAFIGSGLVDEVVLFMAPVFFGVGGVPLADIVLGGSELLPRLKVEQIKRLEDDVLIRGRLV